MNDLKVKATTKTKQIDQIQISTEIKNLCQLSLNLNSSTYIDFEYQIYQRSTHARKIFTKSQLISIPIQLNQKLQIYRQSYSMLNLEDKHKNGNTNINHTANGSAYNDAIKNLQSVLQKNPQQRYQPDFQVISHFIELSPFFNQLSSEISADFSRSLIKKSKVYFVRGKKQIQKRGEAISSLFLTLGGNFLIRANQNKTYEDNTFTKQAQNYRSLIVNSNKNIKIGKQRVVSQKKIVNKSDLALLPVSNFEQLQDLKPCAKQGRLLLGNLVQQKYIEDLYLNGQGWLIALPLQSFYQCLLAEYERMIMVQAEHFRHFRCFNILEDNQLKHFIQKLTIRENKRDQYIYKEGDQSTEMFILIEGEAKAVKTVQLFKQDPNCLYRGFNKNSDSQRRKVQQLDYVNFERVYNYSPKERRIQIGIIEPITIFGEQQILQRSTRQVGIQVTSKTARYYGFTLKKLQESGHGKKVNIERFLSELFESITEQKILTRRKALSSNLELQNKRNMHCFFQSTTPAPKSRPSTSKINNFLCQSSNNRPTSPVKPRYHSLNFNQFIKETQRPSTAFSKQQQQVVKLTHNSTDIVRQIQIQKNMFSKNHGFRYKINIATPLFDTNYYKKQRKEALRIQNKRRMQIISLTGIKQNK